MYILASFVKDEVSIFVWIFLWGFYFVPLIYISVFVPVPYYLDDCSFVVYSEVRQVDSSSSSLPLAGDGPVRSWLALFWYSLSPLFCEWARLCLRAFCGKVLPLSLFFFSLSLAIPQFGLLSYVNSLRLSSGHSGLVLTLSMRPTPPPLTGGRRESLGYFSAGNCD